MYCSNLHTHTHTTFFSLPNVFCEYWQIVYTGIMVTLTCSGTLMPSHVPFVIYFSPWKRNWTQSVSVQLCYLQTPERLSTSVFAILLSSCKVRFIKSKSTCASCVLYYCTLWISACCTSELLYNSCILKPTYSSSSVVKVLAGRLRSNPWTSDWPFSKASNPQLLRALHSCSSSPE